MVSFFKGEHPLRPCNQIVRYQNASTMFCSVCNSSSQGSPEARRVLPSIANRVGDQVADRVGGDRPQTKAHLGEKQKLQTEGKGAPWKFAKADLWRLARQSLKKTSNFDRQACRAHPPIRESFWQSFSLHVCYIEFWRGAYWIERYQRLVARLRMVPTASWVMDQSTFFERGSIGIIQGGDFPPDPPSCRWGRTCCILPADLQRRSSTNSACSFPRPVLMVTHSICTTGC